MKKYLMKMVDKRFLGIPVLVYMLAITFALVFATAGWVIADRVLTIPSNVKIVVDEPGGGGGPGGGGPTYDIAAFIDHECNIPLANINYGTIRPGQASENITIYVKNIGTGAVSVVASASGLDTVTLLGESLSLDAGQSSALGLVLTVSDNATGGDYKIDTVLTATPQP